MPNTPNFNFNEIDVTFAPPTPAIGITLFIGETKRGKIADPSDIYTSWEAYRRDYGGLVAGNPFPQGIKRAIERGTAVRICNVRHYSNLAAGTLDGVKATALASSLLTFSAAITGADNVLSVTVNTNLKTQAFSVNHENTLALMAAQLKTLSGIVEDAFSLFNNTLIIIPKAGVTLTTTSSVAGTGAPTVTVVTEATIEDGSNNTLFTLQPKYIGSDYNNILVKILPATNGDTSAFDIEVIHLGEPDLSEKYSNLKIIGTPTVALSTYLKEIADNSKLVTPVYSDLSAIVSSQITPRGFAYRYSGGTNGGVIVDADYIGDPASKTGFYSADAYGDMSQIAVPEKTSIGILQAGSTYALTRGDLQFFGFLGNFTTEAAAATARDNTLIDTKYAQLYAQYVTVQNELDSQNLNLSPLYDVCGAASYSDINFGPWWSFAGKKRGLFYKVSAVPNNFGTAGNYANKNMLANRQINMPVNDDGSIYIGSNFTAQKALSQYSFGNVTRFVIYLKKSLGPLIKNYIEDPNDIPTWKLMYMAVQPQLDDWGTKRALHGQENVGWRWEGDQFADDITKLVVNNPADVQLGKYRANLFIKPVTALQEIGISIILSPTGVSFEDIISTIQNQ